MLTLIGIPIFVGILFFILFLEDISNNNMKI